MAAHGMAVHGMGLYGRWTERYWQSTMHRMYAVWGGLVWCVVVRLCDSEQAPRGHEQARAVCIS